MIECVYLDENGYDSDVEYARKCGLIKGSKYTFDGIDIEGWSSTIYLKEFEGKEFNSVMFNVFLNGEEIDIVDYMNE